MSEWISVKYQLPPFNKPVIYTQFEYGNKDNPRFYQVAFLNDDLEWYPSFEPYLVDNRMVNPTHWMMLPEPPEEDNAD